MSVTGTLVAPVLGQTFYYAGTFYEKRIPKTLGNSEDGAWNTFLGTQQLFQHELHVSL